MKLHHDQFANVIGYLSRFSDEHSSVVFAPQKDSSVVASIVADEASAEYVFHPLSALKERFGCRIETLKKIAAVATGEIEYRKESMAVFACSNAVWRVPPVDLISIPTARNVDVLFSLCWSGETINHLLRLMKVSSSEQKASSAIDCVLIGATPSRADEDGATSINGQRYMAATNNTVFTYYTERGLDIGEDGSLLLDRNLIPAIADTCESGAQVVFGVGLNSYYVQCGRRKAVFGRRSGMFPKYWRRDILAPARQQKAFGRASATCSELIGAFRGAMVWDGQQIKVSGSGRDLSVACRDDAEVEVSLPSVASGVLGPFSLNGEQATLVLSEWPFGKVVLSYSQPGHPVMLRSTMKDRSGELLSLFMPLIESAEEVEYFISKIDAELDGFVHQAADAQEQLRQISDPRFGDHDIDKIQAMESTIQKLNRNILSRKAVIRGLRSGEVEVSQ